MSRRAPMSIRGRVALTLWGAASLAFVLAAAGLALYQRLTLERRARQILEPYAEMVAVGTDTAVAFEDPDRAREILETLRANPKVLEAEIVLSRGRPLASFSRTADAGPRRWVERPDSVYVGPRMAELLQTLPHDARLRLGIGRDQLDDQTRSALWAFGAGALLLGAVTLLQLSALGRTVVEPIARLTKLSEQVRAHASYDQRVQASGADEVVRLARSFDAMMEAIREREGELRQLSEFQRALLDSAASTIISVTAEGVVTSFNPAAERMLGYRADEVVGKMTPLRWHDADEVARRARQLSGELGRTVEPGFEVFTARPARGLREEHEWTFVRKDGTRLPVLASIAALRDEGGRARGFIGNAYDLTERKRAEQEVVLLNRELERRVARRTAELQAANDELEAFAYSVSHDLRAPLRHVQGFVELLGKKAALDEQAVHYMGAISNASKRMGVLIDDLLSFSRMGRVEMASKPVELGALVRGVIADLEPEVAGRSIDWRVGELPVAIGDGAMLRVVLVNLLSNAVKFTRSRERATIEVGQLPGGDAELVFFVRDDGVGFDMRYVGKLFAVFQRLHRAQEFEGTGIGLANVRRIIARHGGRTWAHGEVGRGATFYFALPHGLPGSPTLSPGR